ncbi:DUF4259 domain-containing protein [Variovorax sp. KK3]|uniref:DUF4259 domain-containing protein n=1 Tax=Variovorax sp. KK3 TaxID=1855728 RepID=UPI0015C37372|nr:DUF4259 domain-containing protein [Variovorax sp. KK3]
MALAAQASAWGEDALDNDAAQDWLAECANVADVSVVSQALDMAQAASYIDADDGASAVAAAEVIAHAIGGARGSAGRAAVAPCLADTPPAELVVLGQQARRALARVGNPAVSELAQLWSENARSRGPGTVRRLAQRLPR